VIRQRLVRYACSTLLAPSFWNRRAWTTLDKTPKHKLSHTVRAQSLNWVRLVRKLLPDFHVTAKNQAWTDYFLFGAFRMKFVTTREQYLVVRKDLLVDTMPAIRNLYRRKTFVWNHNFVEHHTLVDGGLGHWLNTWAFSSSVFERRHQRAKHDATKNLGGGRLLEPDVLHMRLMARAAMAFDLEMYTLGLIPPSCRLRNKTTPVTKHAHDRAFSDSYLGRHEAMPDGGPTHSAKAFRSERKNRHLRTNALRPECWCRTCSPRPTHAVNVTAFLRSIVMYMSRRCDVGHRPLPRRAGAAAHSWEDVFGECDAEACTVWSIRVRKALRERTVILRVVDRLHVHRGRPNDGMVRVRHQDHVWVENRDVFGGPLISSVTSSLQLFGDLDRIHPTLPRESPNCSTWGSGCRYAFHRARDKALLDDPWAAGGRERRRIPVVRETADVVTWPLCDVQEPVLVDHECRTFLHLHPHRKAKDAIAFYKSADQVTCCGPYTVCSKHPSVTRCLQCKGDYAKEFRWVCVPRRGRRNPNLFCVLCSANGVSYIDMCS